MNHLGRMKISLVTPTTPARRLFLEKLAECIDAQDYQDIEWIVLDEYKTGEPKPEKPACMYNISRAARYYEAFSDTVPYSIGKKRNFINSLTTGDVIAHMDDDDWSHPSRLTNQIAFLLKSGAQVTGYHDLLYWDCEKDRGFKYTDPTFRPHAAGTSLCYYRSWWEQHKFVDRQVGEDFLFCITARNAGKLASQDGGQMVVARSHGRNTCAPPFGTKKYPLAPDSAFPSAFMLTVGKSTA